MVPEVRLFASTVEQLAAIRFPSRAFRTDECAELATAVTTTFGKVTALLPPEHNQTRSSAEISRILASAFPMYCHFLRSVAAEQMESFTSSQLATILGFFVPYISSRNRTRQRLTALALKTLARVLASNAERCTQHYSKLLEILCAHIKSDPQSADKDSSDSAVDARSSSSNTNKEAMLHDAGKETVRCAAMECLSGLCTGAARTASSKTGMGENAMARSLFDPLCDILASFVKKAAEQALKRDLRKQAKLARREAIKGKAGGAWTALADDDNDDSESDSNSDTDSDSDGDAEQLTAPEIFVCTSAARALKGLVSVLPALPSSRSKELLSNVHALSAFGIDGTGDHGESILASVTTPHANTSCMMAQEWRV